MKRISPVAFVLLLILNSQFSSILWAQGTTFTYQGQLQNNGATANGSYDLTYGLFNTLIDFGVGAFNGGSNWLEIAVSTNSAGSFSVLSPRQQVTPVPYAITAQNLASVIMNNSIGGGDTVGGGYNNSASNFNSTISGGANNTAAGNAS